MLDAGMDGCRLNMSHCTHDQCRQLVSLVRQLSLERGQPVAIGADLRGPKLRIGDVRGDSVLLEQGQYFELMPGEQLTDARVGYVDYPYLSEGVKPGDPVLLNDGMLVLRALGTKGDGIVCEVEKGGVLSSRKGVNLPGVPLRLPSLTPKDRADMAVAVDAGVDFLFLSYTRSRQHLEEVRHELALLGPSLPLVAKIERQEGVDALAEIVDAADGICIARGDLGIETSLAAVPAIQREAVRLCRESGKFVMNGGQLLASMTFSPIPLRAEVADLNAAVRDGLDAVVLSDETAAGSYPVEAVRIAASVIEAAERETPRATNETGWGFRHGGSGIGAALVVSRDGGAVQRLSAKRGASPIVAATDQPRVAQWLSTWWGVRPVLVDDCSDPGSAARQAIEAAGGLLVTSQAHRPLVLHDLGDL